jgi:cytochrome c biogenesis protein CcmG/thiol:disulfide interchange protein DsbE
MSRYVLPLVAVVVLVIFLVIGLTRGDPRALPSPYIGKPAPEFDLPTLKDPSLKVASKDLEGNLALVNVWATWCVGCRQEHPFLLELASEKTIPIYGINWRDTRPEALRVYGAPETFLLGADGVVLHKHLGPLNRESWERDFVPLIESGGAAK